MSLVNYEKLGKGAKAARVGLDNEKNIVHLINTDEEFKKLIQKSLETLGFETNNIKEAINVKRRGAKTDVLLRTSSNELGISLKTVSKPKFDFNQVQRGRLEAFAKTFEMPEEIYKIFKTSILRKAEAENSRKCVFIEENNREKIAEFFLNKIDEVMCEIFTRKEDNLKIFIISNLPEKKLYIFNMNDLLNFLIRDGSKISFKKDTGIIYLGEFVSIQRKGGDGNVITYPKKDYRHPSNDLQFKFSPLKFAKYCEESGKVNVSIIKY